MKAGPKRLRQIDLVVRFRRDKGWRNHYGFNVVLNQSVQEPETEGADFVGHFEKVTGLRYRRRQRQEVSWERLLNKIRLQE